MANYANWKVLLAALIVLGLFAEYAVGSTVVSKPSPLSSVKLEQKDGVRMCGPYVAVVDGLVVAFHDKEVDGVRYFNKHTVKVRVVVREDLREPSLERREINGAMILVVTMPDMASALAAQPCLTPPSPDPRRRR